MQALPGARAGLKFVNRESYYFACIIFAHNARQMFRFVWSYYYDDFSELCLHANNISILICIYISILWLHNSYQTNTQIILYYLYRSAPFRNSDNIDDSTSSSASMINVYLFNIYSYIYLSNLKLLHSLIIFFSSL